MRRWIMALVVAGGLSGWLTASPSWGELFSVDDHYRFNPGRRWFSRQGAYFERQDEDAAAQALPEDEQELLPGAPAGLEAAGPFSPEPLESRDTPEMEGRGPVSD